MHTTKFSVNQSIDTEFDTAQEAIDYVESIGAGNVVKFIGSPNLPYCLPAIVFRSCAMWAFKDGVWNEHYIFGGYGEVVGQSKPS